MPRPGDRGARRRRRHAVQVDADDAEDAVARRREQHVVVDRDDGVDGLRVAEEAVGDVAPIAPREDAEHARRCRRRASPFFIGASESSSSSWLSDIAPSAPRRSKVHRHPSAELATSSASSTNARSVTRSRPVKLSASVRCRRSHSHRAVVVARRDARRARALERAAAAPCACACFTRACSSRRAPLQRASLPTLSTLAVRREAHVPARALVRLADAACRLLAARRSLSCPVTSATARRRRVGCQSREKPMASSRSYCWKGSSSSAAMDFVSRRAGGEVSGHVASRKKFQIKQRDCDAAGGGRPGAAHAAVSIDFGAICLDSKLP